MRRVATIDARAVRPVQVEQIDFVDLECAATAEFARKAARKSRQLRRAGAKGWRTQACMVREAANRIIFLRGGGNG